jgi:acyl carrier protein
MVSKEEFRRAVIEGVKRVRDLESIDVRDDESFADVGLDSLDGMNLVLEVESTLGIDLGEFDLKEANTIDRFYDKACQILASRE